MNGKRNGGRHVWGHGGQAWAPEDKALAHALHNEGKTDRQIAVVLGYKLRRVINFFHRPPKRVRQIIAKARRNCLGCGAPFLSEWIGNRLCPYCSVAAEELDGEDYTVTV